jgi:hypothetical protein
MPPNHANIFVAGAGEFDRRKKNLREAADH